MLEDCLLKSSRNLRIDAPAGADGCENEPRDSCKDVTYNEAPESAEEEPTGTASEIVWEPATKQEIDIGLTVLQPPDLDYMMRPCKSEYLAEHHLSGQNEHALLDGEFVLKDDIDDIAQSSVSASPVEGEPAADPLDACSPDTLGTSGQVGNEPTVQPINRTRFDDGNRLSDQIGHALIDGEFIFKDDPDYFENDVIYDHSTAEELDATETQPAGIPVADSFVSPSPVEGERTTHSVDAYSPGTAGTAGQANSEPTVQQINVTGFDDGNSLSDQIGHALMDGEFILKDDPDYFDNDDIHDNSTAGELDASETQPAGILVADSFVSPSPVEGERTAHSVDAYSPGTAGTARQANCEPTVQQINVTAPGEGNHSNRQEARVVLQRMAVERCNVCAGVFASQAALNAHTCRQGPHNRARQVIPIPSDSSIKHPGTSSEVPRVNKTDSKVLLNVPVLTANGTYSCNLCEKYSSSSRKLLKRHMLRHSSNKRLPCDICEKTFLYNSELIRHKLSHTGAKRYYCDICKNWFLWKSKLLSHILTHGGLRKYRCTPCGKYFSDRVTLNSHLLTHNIDKKQFCNICNKMFPLRGWAQHLVAHATYKYCKICNKGFTDTKLLRSHMLIHTNKRIFRCNLCEMAFMRLKIYQNHMLEHATNVPTPIPEPYRCDTCKQMFSTEITLKNHKTKRCNCLLLDLARHMKYHKGEHNMIFCDICGKCFRSRILLKVHMRTKRHELKYSCDICKNKFRNKLTWMHHLNKKICL